MSSRSEAERLHDVIENVDWITDYLAGLDFSAFSCDRRTLDAVERCLQRITEAVIHVGIDRMAVIMPGLPAYAVRSMGNVLRHEYHKIDVGTLWRTIHQDLPDLKAACLSALGNSVSDR